MRYLSLTGLSLFISIFSCIAQKKNNTIFSGQQIISQLAYADSGRLVEIYKDLHQHPELGFQEVRTSGILAKELQSLGYEVITGLAKTGVAGIMRNGNGPVIMYRADMDCNSVKEVTGLPYASTQTMKKEDGTETPVMHACGHDAHVTWLIGIAKIMAAKKDLWKGTLVFIGQPAEEPMTGAKAMEGEMYGKGVPIPDHMFGLHTWPIPVGSINNGYNVRFAGSDQLDVTFQGVGGHGSSPEVTKDPIVMAANAIMQYQTIISRNVAAQEAAVLTVGAIHSGVDNNVIPASATVKLNLRWFNDKTRQTLIDGIQRINEAVAVANGLPKDLYPVINFKSTVTPLVNDTAMVNRVNQSLQSLGGIRNIISNAPSVMGSEDFQHLVKKGSATVYDYIQVGTANVDEYTKAIKEGKKGPYFNHNGNYKVDLSAIPLGTAIGAVGLMELFRR
ncbi:MAG: amidohydrolase [Chitinophagaceae bacterium]